MVKKKRGKDEPTIIKKYANRRLYDTGRSSYVTLDDLCEMVREGYAFIVLDAKTGEDITRPVLAQIIVDKESNGVEGENLLPTNFLRQLISFYGNNVQSILPNYLETTLDLFVKNQEQMREQINKSFEGIKPMSGMFHVPALDEINRQNMAMFQRAMENMFKPFGMSNFTPPAKSEKKSEE
ncbi:MAG: polyhydroxyalkanoate synthesis repressor PhaR [Alphaproteobacteria bacterium]